MSGFGVFSHLLLLLFASLVIVATSNNVNVSEMQPLMEPMVASDAEASGQSQICALCTCCDSGTCRPHPCCMDVVCNLPNRPKGNCAFVPKRCTCEGCNTLNSTP